VRPEKIRIADPGDPEPSGLQSATGKVAEVVYLGVVTRYVVDLDDGGRLVAVKQNLESSSQEALDEAGRRVRLEWRPEHSFTIEPD
jgi:putative spermidine/putrescine transport system ATP-binding protein